ncbi:MAG: malectin domain-containing carbohydrate-binding protein [Verrucomicrobia bacterium]|nr:malectin domain-containing carbohydrate-binding protein [Verrucomicrobiota bacterium]
MQTPTTLLSLAMAGAALGGTAIVCPPAAPAQVELAAKEVRRYIYLRTGELLPITASGAGITLQIDPALAAQQYRLQGDGTTLAITGGSGMAVLYGVYHFAEKLGVRFYLHGDVIPDEQSPLVLPVLDETAQPWFALRGIQPFHDFMEGPDWWNADDYKAYASQLAKLRMNFLGLHNYPERHGGYPGPEPTVWIGLSDDCDDRGRVTRSYPAFFANTLRPGWGNVPMKTSQYAGGAASLFDADVFGPDVQRGQFPWPAEPAACNEVFNRTADMYRDAFSFARSLGINICVGTETPLTVPQLVKERLQSQGRDPADPAVVRDLYKGIFKRLARAFPVDYYWLWTPEDWTWGGNQPGQLEKTRDDLRAALGALADLGHPFPLATCGWVLGPAHDRAALDAILPPTSPMACINRQVGHEGVEPAFANLSGRPKWAIPWLENDPNMVGPQPWVARMRYDAVEARRFGCTGLFGLHWRVKALEMNVAALAAAGWDQAWVPAGFDTTPVTAAKSGDGALGGQTASFTAPVAGTTEPTIYQTVRFDLNGYQLAVPDGTYTVTLQFNEPAYTAAGKRVFGVKLQGRQVVTGLDVFARVGANKALDLGYPDIAVSAGSLGIEFTREVEFPCIAGITILGATKATNQVAGRPFARRINCGGPQTGEYEADTAAGGSTVPPAGKTRAMPVGDFYQDYARANFGGTAATAIAGLLEKLDGVALPEPSTWSEGPGALVATATPWAEQRKRYAFVDELAAWRAQVKGAGNLERFDYWLNTYQAMATMAEVSCLRGQLDQAMTGKDFQVAVAARIGLAAAWSRLLTLQTAIVRTPGELGTIANLEHQTRARARFVDGHDEALVKALGHPLPAQATLSQNYTGPARLIVPCVRSGVTKGEVLQLRIIALDHQPVASVTVQIRPLGKGEWQTIAARHLGRAVYQATLPAAENDFEYRISAATTAGTPLVWPATAPGINQTVVVAPSRSATPSPAPATLPSPLKPPR